MGKIVQVKPKIEGAAFVLVKSTGVSIREVTSSTSNNILQRADNAENKNTSEYKNIFYY